MKPESDLSFWARWVLANSISETIGLGGAFLAGYGILALIRLPEGAASALVIAGVAIALGTAEGAIVGGAQGAVIRRRLGDLALRRWVLATAAGAMLAWTMGMLPSTIMSLAPQPAGDAQPGLPDSLMYLMAAGLGALAGPILACAQWLVLREHVARASLWIPANAAAWMVGMPLTFVAADWIQARASTVAIVFALLGAAALTGAVVGAIHGTVLVRMLVAGRGMNAAPGTPASEEPTEGPGKSPPSFGQASVPSGKRRSTTAGGQPGMTR